MRVRILIGFFAGAVFASVGTYWFTHRPSAVPVAVEAPAPAPPANTAPPKDIGPVASAPASAPDPTVAPAPVKKPVVAKKHAAPKLPIVAHRLPSFKEQMSDIPMSTPTPTPDPKPVEIAAAPPPVDVPVAQPAPEPVTVNPADDVPAPAPPQPNSVTLTAGTVIPVRIGENLSTKKNRPGDTFAGTLDQELDVDGFVIAEKGARVEGRIAGVEEAGRMRGLSHLSIELTRLYTSDGQTVGIRTDPFEKLGPQSRRSEAEKVGVGTLLGAVIGATAGGGKGAAIGAGAGAVAGAGAAAATRGRPAEIPVETVVSFKVNQPVTITEKLQ